MLINQASADPQFKDHPGLLELGIESYIAVPLVRRDGSYFGTLCALDPLPANLTEDTFEVFALLANLIAFELEADEDQRRREAELRAMEDFLAIAAHDLRQPLTILNIRAQLLARKARREIAHDDLQHGLAEIVANTRRATQLSETLLDLARIHTGSLTLDLTRFDLAGLAQQLVDDASTMAPHHTFELVKPARIGVEADERRLGQVLRNLLDNAVKYVPSDRGPIIIQLAECHSHTDKHRVHISVRDHGDGVAEAELPLLFERHYRTSKAEATQTQGTGLGLYITRLIIEAHHGSIWAENAPGGGLVVHITLPVTQRN